MTESNSLTLPDIRHILVSCGRKLAAALGLQRKALVATEREPLAAAAEKMIEVERVLADLREWYQENGGSAANDETASERRRLQGCLNGFEGIAAAAKRLQREIERKMESDVFFSDLAMREAGQVYAQARRQVRDVADALATDNPTLRMHVLSWCDHAAHLMNEFTKFHEERLLEGTCSTQAGDIFMGLFEAFHDVCYHVRHLALAIPEDQGDL